MPFPLKLGDFFNIETMKMKIKKARWEKSVLYLIKKSMNLKEMPFP